MDFVFDPSLVLYLPLYELDGASFMSKDARGHLCTVTGALWRPNGHYFDGTNDYIDCGSSSEFDITSEITFGGWIKPSGVASNVYIMSKDNPGVGQAYGLRQVTTAIQTQMRIGGDWKQISSSGLTLTTTEFFCVEVTFDGSTITVFANGGVSNTGAASGAIGTSSYNVFLGRKANANADNYGGLISEFWLYNRALTPQEIQHNYLATKWRYR